jgi:Domain of unknown function (DUF4331)
MSSHREAPEISTDPVADSTDVYAFVSPDAPGTVTLIANYVPLQEPSGGPNFYSFGNDVLYEIHVSNAGTSQSDISYQFQFSSRFTTPDSFLYNTGPITSLGSPNWNSKQFYSVTRKDHFGTHLLGSNLACPPCNVGVASTPNYEANLGAPAVHSLGNGIKVFAGQRAEQFYVDLGSIFDLGDLRPIQQLNAFNGMPAANGVNATDKLNVHTIAIQVPIPQLTFGHNPTIGVWTTASRQRVQIENPGNGANFATGPFTQVSRLGNPLVNEVLIPLGKKDYWNKQQPATDSQFATYVAHPELAGLLPVLYPWLNPPTNTTPAFPNLKAYVTAGTPRADLVAILLTGIPAGVAGSFTNYTGNVQADMLRLNTSIPATPTNSNTFSTFGLLGGDPAGFPNGRRITDDVVKIELQAIAGLTIPLVDPTYTKDAAVGAVTDGLDGSSVTNGPKTQFPYMGIPYDGYHNPS